MKEANFRCSYCHHDFVHEDRLLKHKCKQMMRAEEFQTQPGQAAWLHYQTWMKAAHKMVPPVKSFLHSKFFNAFVRFAKFIKDVRIPDPEIYIRFMIELDIPPVMFTNDQIYSAFLIHMDKKIPAVKNAKITIDTLFNLAEDNNIDISQVFEQIDPNDIIQLVRQRKLSAWLLLRSRKFMTMCRDRMSRDQRILLETIIIPKIWAQKLNDNPQDVKAIDEFVKALEL